MQGEAGGYDLGRCVVYGRGAPEPALLLVGCLCPVNCSSWRKSRINLGLTPARLGCLLLLGSQTSRLALVSSLQGCWVRRLAGEKSRRQVEICCLEMLSFHCLVPGPSLRNSSSLSLSSVFLSLFLTLSLFRPSLLSFCLVVLPMRQTHTQTRTRKKHTTRSAVGRCRLRMISERGVILRRGSQKVGGAWGAGHCAGVAWRGLGACAEQYRVPRVWICSSDGWTEGAVGAVGTGRLVG